MKNPEFNKLLKSITVKGTISPAKARTLSSDQRDGMSKLIIRKRQPVVVCLLPDVIDESWLNAMGYLYHSTSAKNGLVFRHTCEHVIQ